MVEYEQPTGEFQPTKQQAATAKAIKKRVRALAHIKTKHRVLAVAILFTAVFFGRNFVWIDFPNDCFVVIAPSLLDLNNGTIKGGIKILKNIAPDEYQDMCEYVSYISPNIPPSGCPSFGGGCVQFKNPSKIYILGIRNNYIWMSGLIAHETCHARQFSEGSKEDLLKIDLEPECDEVLKEILDAVQVKAL